MSAIKAIVFDAYGTLLRIDDKRRPYARLLEAIRETGREITQEDKKRVMTSNVGLVGVTELFQCHISGSLLSALEQDLFSELMSVSLYPDVELTLNTLRDRGYKIAVCSNLAAPYALPVKTLLPFEFDAYVWSFEAAAVKPEAAIYDKTCTSLACLPEEIIMVGDTLLADYRGPRQFGMQSLHLARNGKSPVTDALVSLDELLPMLEGC
jgi:FMN phosphatase YigB (HAD superfamily)